MTLKKVEDNNPIIAEFMGVRVTHNHGNQEIDHYYFEDGAIKSVIDLKYDESWDWLIPVLGRILDVIDNHNLDMEDYYKVVDGIPDLDATYEEVINFIKKYNKMLNNAKTKY